METTEHKREAGHLSAPRFSHSPHPTFNSPSHQSPAPPSPQTETPVLHPPIHRTFRPSTVGPGPTPTLRTCAPQRRPGSPPILPGFSAPQRSIRSFSHPPGRAPLNAGPVPHPHPARTFRPSTVRPVLTPIPGAFAPQAKGSLQHPSPLPHHPGSSAPSSGAPVLHQPSSPADDGYRLRLPCRCRPGYPPRGSTCGSTARPRTRPRGASPTQSRWGRSRAR